MTNTNGKNGSIYLNVACAAVGGLLTMSAVLIKDAPSRAQVSEMIATRLEPQSVQIENLSDSLNRVEYKLDTLIAELTSVSLEKPSK